MFARLLSLALVFFMVACDATTPADRTTDADSTGIPTDPVKVTTSLLIRPYYVKDSEPVYGDSVVVEASGAAIPVRLDSAWVAKVNGVGLEYSMPRQSGNFFAFLVDTCTRAGNIGASVILASEQSEPSTASPTSWSGKKAIQTSDECKIYAFAIRGFGAALSQMPDSVFTVSRNQRGFSVPLSKYVLAGEAAITRENYPSLANPANGLYEYTFSTKVEGSRRDVLPLYVYRRDNPYASWQACIGECVIALDHSPYGDQGTWGQPPYEDRMRYYVFLIYLPGNE